MKAFLSNSAAAAHMARRQIRALTALIWTESMPAPASLSVQMPIIPHITAHDATAAIDVAFPATRVVQASCITTMRSDTRIRLS